MDGITYYRLKSDYPGDYTKNCALNGTEVDNNFYVLEGRDIKSIYVRDKDIVVTLLNGESVTATDALNFVKSEDLQNGIVNMEFDSLNGVLKLTFADGTIQQIDGFATNENTDFSVSTDNTICGDGLRNAPLGVAPSARTGQYKTVKSIIDTTSGAALPKCGNVIGDRYVTCEDISDYGYLYDYRGVREIACELQNSEWRIPTKADWDDLLNAVEPCECDKTHDKADKNKVLGKWAGKFLKSKTMWHDSDCGDSCECDTCNKECYVETSCGCGCNKGCDCTNNSTCFDYTDNPCVGTKECEQKCKCETSCGDDHRGIDAYGFRVTPAGYADDGCNYGFFKERCAYWTATTDNQNAKAYIKRFQNNKCGVYQDVIAGNYHLSLRLVKDYDGKNYFDTEEIMDMEYPTLLLPSTSKGKAIWTSVNFACGNASLKPMLPNNGQGITYTRHYFINEWDGFKWVRNELKQGESVVVAKATKGKEMIEYRLIGNDFVSVNEIIYKDVIEDVDETIEKVTKEIYDKIETVEKSVEAETDERKSADDKLQASIDALEEKTDKTNENLNHTNQVLKDFSDETNKAFGIINDVIKQSVDTINQSITNETDARINADKEINDNLEEIRGMLLTSDGTEFANGKLMLKSKAGTNDIEVPLSFDFGDFK